MSPSIRRMLWGAFAGLALLTAAGTAFTITVLRMDQRQEYAVVQQSRPLLEAVRDMDDALDMMVSASRGYVLNGDAAFRQQYDDAVRKFNTAAESQALTQATNPRDRNRIKEFKAHYTKIKGLTDKQIARYKA